MILVMDEFNSQFLFEIHEINPFMLCIIHAKIIEQYILLLLKLSSRLSNFTNISISKFVTLLKICDKKNLIINLLGFSISCKMSWKLKLQISHRNVCL